MVGIVQKFVGQFQTVNSSPTPFSFPLPTVAGNVIAISLGSATALRFLEGAVWEGTPMILGYDERPGHTRYAFGYYLEGAASGTTFTLEANVGSQWDITAFELEGVTFDQAFSINEALNDPAYHIPAPGFTSTTRHFFISSLVLNNSGEGLNTGPPEYTWEIDGGRHLQGWGDYATATNERVECVFNRSDRPYNAGVMTFAAGPSKPDFYSLPGEIHSYVPTLDDDKDGTSEINDLTDANEGTITSMTWTPDTDRRGVRALVSGAGSVLDLDSLVFADNEPSWSVSAWIKTTSTGATAVFAQSDDADEYSHAVLTQVGKIAYQNGGAPVVSNGLINDGNWRHVVIACEEVGTVDIYIDGQFDNSGPATSYTGDPSTNATIGAIRLGGVFNSFVGSLDAIRFFDTKLSASEVTSIYNQERNSWPTSLVDAPLAAGGAQFSAAAEFTAPLAYSASAALTSGAAEFFATATATVPAYQAAAALTAGGAQLAAAATFDAGLFLATSNLSVAPAQFSAVASASAALRLATAALSAGAAEFSSAAKFVPSFVATAALSSGAAQFSAAATFVPTFAASASLAAGSAEFTAFATFSVGPTAFADLVAGPAQFAAFATNTLPPFVPAERITIKNIILRVPATPAVLRSPQTNARLTTF